MRIFSTTLEPLIHAEAVLMRAETAEQAGRFDLALADWQWLADRRTRWPRYSDVVLCGLARSHAALGHAAEALALLRAIATCGRGEESVRWARETLDSPQGKILADQAAASRRSR